ncbi:MAG: tRNA modification GTPase MnmE [Pirellulaceae bacterium]|nr:MAG: tRNA modification GTPase MnmE [Pirellulaceae bacterium]
MDVDDTIVAISSADAPAVRGIVRLSGPRTNAVLSQFFFPIGTDREPPANGSCPATKLPTNGRAVRLPGTCRLHVEGSPLDSYSIDAHCLWWPSTRSYTGQPSAELHVVGSLPILAGLVETAIACGARLARPGEFTLRAFLAGKLDLAQAEAVLGVIEAQTPEELHAALAQLAGNLSHPVRHLRDEMIELLAHLEAGLDFVEEDIEFISAETLHGRLQAIDHQLASLLQQIESRGHRLSEPRVVLVGYPNAGKSSLFNALLGRPHAIVSDRAGTTRDAVSSSVDLGGLRIECIDTAGWEEWQDDSPRAVAQQHLRIQLQRADWLLLCVDPQQVPPTAWQALLAEVQPFAPVTVLWTKADQPAHLPDAWESGQATGGALEVSIHRPETIETLKQHLRQALSNSTQGPRSSALLSTLTRCHAELIAARQALHSAIASVNLGAADELVAADLRWVIDRLAGVMGEVHSEDILDNIFSRFCIGK